VAEVYDAPAAAALGIHVGQVSVMIRPARAASAIGSATTPCASWDARSGTASASGPSTFLRSLRSPEGQAYFGAMARRNCLGESPGDDEPRRARLHAGARRERSGTGLRSRLRRVSGTSPSSRSTRSTACAAGSAARKVRRAPSVGAACARTSVSRDRAAGHHSGRHGRYSFLLVGTACDDVDVRHRLSRRGTDDESRASEEPGAG
jgi:hypothetical protein